MGSHSLRAMTFGLLASTALAAPAFAQDPPTSDSPAPNTNATDVTAPPATVQQAQDGLVPDSTEIIITATKREENLQDVPISIQAIGSRRLEQLNVQNFEDYTKQLPSVSFQTAQPGVTVVYMRGVASGGDGNHSGSFPSVGTYLDEQPVTTIGGTLDVHIYDIARIESLAGPQGTLYGASSQAGTIRIITNKPDPDRFEGRVDGEVNQVLHGGMGGTLEGMINLPISSFAAFRGSAFYRKDGGYIDNVSGSRTYYIFDDDVDDLTVTNSGLEEKNFNDQRVFGGRAALKVDLDDNWTVTPAFFYQNLKANGVFFFDPELGDQKIDRFRDEVRKDKFWQAALTIQGKIANFDITYAGAFLDRKTFGRSDYTDYTDAYDQLYSVYYTGLTYYPLFDAAGDWINPQQYIVGGDHFTKMSHEVRIASPAENPLRFIAGAFYQRQTNHIFQNYLIDGLQPRYSVNGLPGTVWLTDQQRIDRDYALFGEVNWDVTPQITLTAGGRLFKFNNTLFGFFGFGRDPADGGRGPYSAFPYNGGMSSRTGVAGCFTVTGERLYSGGSNGVFSSNRTFITDQNYGIAPCVNLGDFQDGRIVPKRKKGDGFTHRLNAQYKPNDDLMFYATWSRGFRPAGINRRGTVEPYEADYLSNWEVGWKTTFGPVRWNGAIYHQLWKDFQYSFLGANSFTEIHNANDAKINGIETDLNYTGGGLTINASAAFTDAKTSGGDVCGFTASTNECLDNLSNPGTPNFVSVPNGTRLPVTPRFKMATTARYTWPVFTGARAHLQGGVAYQSSAAATLRTALLQAGTFAIVNPRSYMGRIRGAALYDFAAGLTWDRFNVEAFVLNLLDRRNEVSRGVACGSCTRTLIVPGTPRTVGLRAGMKF